MNKERIVTQRLADIKALISYVREGIDKLTNEANSEKLDDMGSATLTILTTLKDVQEGILASEELITNAHSNFTQKNYDQLEQPLQEVLDKINDSQNIQKTSLVDIQKAYDNYTEAFDKVQETINEHQERSAEGRQKIEEGINVLGNSLDDINQKIPSKESYQELLKNIKDMIKKMIEVERDKVYQNEEDLKLVDSELKTSQTLIIDTNKRLDDIHTTYEESTARLSVIDSKIDTMINIFKDHQPSLGGIKDDE